MCRCSNFKYWSVKILLLKLASELPNLVKNFQFVLKVWTKSKLNFHEVEYTPPSVVEIDFLKTSGQRQRVISL